MYSILKILLGLKLTLLLLILSLGTGIVIEKPSSPDFDNSNISWDLKFAGQEPTFAEPVIMTKAVQNPEKILPVKQRSKASSLSELGLYIEL